MLMQLEQLDVAREVAKVRVDTCTHSCLVAYLFGYCVADVAALARRDRQATSFASVTSDWN
jgi:hypothetical protein